MEFPFAVRALQIVNPTQSYDWVKMKTAAATTLCKQEEAFGVRKNRSKFLKEHRERYEQDKGRRGTTQEIAKQAAKHMIQSVEKDPEPSYKALQIRVSPYATTPIGAPTGRKGEDAKGEKKSSKAGQQGKGKTTKDSKGKGPQQQQQYSKNDEEGKWKRYTDNQSKSSGWNYNDWNYKRGADTYQEHKDKEHKDWSEGHSRKKW